RFGNAAEKNGTSLESVARALRFLEVNREKALSGSQAMINSFAALGLSIEDLKSKRIEDIWLKMGDSALNAADYVKVAGKAALETRPLIAGLADGTIQFGTAISAIDIKQLKAANVAIQELKEHVTILVGTG